MTPSEFVEMLPARLRSVVRVGDSGDGYGGAGLELKLDVWAAHFRAERFRDGWIDFGFGSGRGCEIVPPDEDFVTALEAFVAHQDQSLVAVPGSFFPSIPMLRESLDGYDWAGGLVGLDRPEDLRRVMSPNVIHALVVSKPPGFLIGAVFLTAWECDIGFLLNGGAVIAAGEQVAETAWMAQAAVDGTLTLTDAYWLAPGGAL